MAIMHDKLKELRSKSGMTLAQIADALGTTEATAQRYESGKGIKSIPYDVIEKYANIFGCTPQYIMGWEEEVKKKNNLSVEVVLRMESDPEFFDLVETLCKLDVGKIRSIKKMLENFL